MFNEEEEKLARAAAARAGKTLPTYIRDLIKADHALSKFKEIG